LFSPLKLGPITLANRMIMAPMTRNRAGAGNVPTDLMATYYAQRAGAGLIITEATQVSDTAQGYPSTPGLHTDAQIAGWKCVTDAVHARGGTIFAQIWHVGRISHPVYQPNGAQPVAPSAIAAKTNVITPAGYVPTPPPRALETGEIVNLVADFAAATLNARAAGFDGVEIHAANGYLIDQFLRDGTNVRTDRYGGAVENRARFLLEIVRAASAAWESGRVGVRLSPSGTFNDMRDSNPRYAFGHAAAELAKLNLAYLHVIEGNESDAKHYGQGYDPIPASYFKRLFNGVLIANGGFDADKSQQYLAAGWADAISFGAPFLANPDLPERFRRGAPLNAPDVSTMYGGTERGYTDYPTLSA
jgi:N-ethylmaleimide reductase